MKHPALLALMAASLICSCPASADTIKVEIVTEIRDKPGATQVGEKSRQTLTIDTAAKTVASEWKTGKTVVAGQEITSVRNKFEAQLARANAPFTIAVKATGSTASGVGILPNIDYSLTLSFDTAKHTIGVVGSHDGYPSYTILVGTKKVYDHEQGNLSELVGDGDVTVDKTASY